MDFKTQHQTAVLIQINNFVLDYIPRLTFVFIRKHIIYKLNVLFLTDIDK